MPRTYQGGTGGERIPRMGIEHHEDMRHFYQTCGASLIGIAAATIPIAPLVAIGIDIAAVPFVGLARLEQRKIKALQQSYRSRCASNPH